MWQIIAIAWLILALPIAWQVDNDMRKGDNPLRKNIIVNLMIFCKILITTPIYYTLLIASLFTAKK